MGRKRKDNRVEKKGLFGNATDYSVYHLSTREKVVGMLAGYIISFLALQVFFQTWFVSLILSVAFMPVGKRVYRNILQNKRSTALVLQFKEMLEALTTSYDSGKNTMEAFQDAYIDMKTQYGTDAYIVKELQIILKGIQNNITIEDVLTDFAERSGNEDIESFADVFRASNRAGGNIKKIIAETKNIITDKINIEMEIETLVSGKKNELNIMILLPFIVVTQVQGFQGENTGSLQSLMISIGIRIVALSIFVAAYVIGARMVKIEI